MNSNSHLAAYSYSDKGKEQLKTSRLEPIGNQAVSRTFAYRNLFNSFPFQTKELIPQSLQPSQNPAKTQEELLSTAPPRFAEDPEISISPPELVKLCATAIPPAAWRQNLVSRFQPSLCWSENIGKIELHNGPHYIPKSADIANNTCSFFTKGTWTRHIGRKKLHNRTHCIGKSSATIAKDNNTVSILFINWLSRWAQAKCCQSEKSKTPSLTSHAMNNQQPGTTHDATVYHFETILLCQIRNLAQYQRLRWTQTATLLPTHTQIRGRNNWKHQESNQLAIKLCLEHWWHIMEIYGNLFNSFRFSDPRVDLPEPAAISKSRQRPKRNSWARHLHVSPRTLKFGFFPQNWWSFSPHKSHLRRGGRTWYPDSNRHCAGLKILEK